MKQAHVKFIDMTTIDVRTPDDWCKIHQVTVLDPDGWRVDGLSWETHITEQEFHSRVQRSTIGPLNYRDVKPPAEPVRQPAPDESATSRPDSSSSTEGQKSPSLEPS
jgi:hypothetical protein